MLQRYTLPNGIPVFIVESHASPVVSVQAWVNRGSAYESDQLAGISHFLEHALFKGTKRRKVGEIALEIESRGGEINAFTSFEETCYYATLASRYFEDGLDVIADAVQNPLFDKEEMIREREVILEEIKRAQDSPYKVVSTNLWKASFPQTPYGRPVLGFESTVRKLDHKVLRQYFDKHYHAGSLSLVVVGDVDADKAAVAVRKSLGRARKGKRGGLPVLRSGARSKGVQVITNQRDLKECQVQIAFLAPAITDGRIPPLDLLCSAVGQGESSRLYQRLVKEKQLALEAHMGLVATGRCGLATLGMTVAPENLEPAIQEALKVLSEVANRGLEESEIERVKSSLEAEVIGGKETVEGYARRLGYYYVQFGDPDYEKKYLEEVLAVTEDEACGSLRALFANKPVVSLVHPLNHSVDKKKIAACLGEKPAKRVAVATASNLPEKTERGPMTFVTKVVKSLPIVALRILFPGGTREEEKHQYGVGNLFQRVWASGTRSYTSLQIAQSLESLGASLYAFSGKNTVGLSVEFLSKQWPIIKPILSEVLLQPSFPEDEFVTEKNLMLREILAERDTPGQICHLNFLSALYGHHPYGRSSLGTRESVSALTIGDLQKFYRSYIHRRRVVLSTVGNFQHDGWIDELEKICRELPASGKEPMGPIPIVTHRGLKVVAEKKEPLFQSHLMLGFLGASFSDPERYALKLLSSSLAGQGGRLFLELRDRQSLAYQVAPISSDNPERGLFAFYIGCSPEKLEKSISGIRAEIEKILEKPLAAKELDRAKKYWIGRFELEMQRFSAQAMLFGLDETYGLGYRHALEVPETIRATSADAIQRAAQKFLLLDNATFSIVHNQPLDESVVARAWGGKSLSVAPPRERIADETL